MPLDDVDELHRGQVRVDLPGALFPGFVTSAQSHDDPPALARLMPERDGASLHGQPEQATLLHEHLHRDSHRGPEPAGG